ncbi:auxin-responsive protein SAUR36-like [Zingiber officinale]|uniref:auxin-responsive protein SAUR36-like n=1 Tax=Zingiber officinale TaxID=94328 RepID=UPI001C4B816D|nr:auxin-responsive protein SAUR36-like [Zingiber officinale]
MKYRGVRLGLRLIRRRAKRYLRLDRDAGSQSSSTMTAKLCDWGRLLVSRLPSFRIRRAYRKMQQGESEAQGGLPPKGYLSLYVGDAKKGGAPRRYTVPVMYFNHPLFAELLQEAEKEFGFRHPGGITIPCSAAKFELVRTRIAAGDTVATGRSNIATTLGHFSTKVITCLLAKSRYTDTVSGLWYTLIGIHISQMCANHCRMYSKSKG